MIIPMAASTVDDTEVTANLVPCTTYLQEVYTMVNRRKAAVVRERDWRDGEWTYRYRRYGAKVSLSLTHDAYYEYGNRVRLPHPTSCLYRLSPYLPQLVIDMQVNNEDVGAFPARAWACWGISDGRVVPVSDLDEDTNDRKEV